ncbi:hypothetical protein Tco_0662897 [Tanacetum coccineum]
MSTSKTYQQSLFDAGSETRPPMLERGSYIPWASSIIPPLQTAEDLEGDDLLLYDVEMEVMNMILLSIPNEIYNSVDACTLAKDMVNIQSRNSGNTRRNSRRAYVQEEVVEGMNAPKETGNWKRTLAELVQAKFMTRSISWSKCCCQNRMKLALIHTDEHRMIFSLLTHQGMQKLKNSSNICLMPKSTIPLVINQINSKVIKFDSFKGNVNSGSVEKDTHVPDLCVVEKLARNAYQEAEKQQIFAQQVQKQNTHLTSQLEMYKERVWILENINKDNNYLNEFLEADERAKYLEAKLKKNVDLILKLGDSLQGMFMLGPKPLSVYDQQLKHGLGYLNPYTLKKAILKCPKLYVASSLGNLEIPLNVRDSEDTLEGAFKSQQKMTEKINDPIAVANKQNCCTINYKKINALYKDFVPQKVLSVEQKYFPSSSIPSVKIPVSRNMPSGSPLIKELDKIKGCFKKLSLLIQQNCKRASIFYTSLAEIQINDFCQDQVKPILNKLKVYLDFFRNLFQRDIKEMKDVFKSTERELDELEKQNHLLKDQLLEASLKHDVELCVLINHECVDKILNDELEKVKKKSFEIQEGLQARIKILEKDVQRCQKQSVDFQLKMEKLENENVSSEFKVQSLIKECDNVKIEYQKLFDSIKKTRYQTQKEMDELIVHVFEKTYAYGAICAENQNLLSTISELKTRLEKVEKVLEIVILHHLLDLNHLDFDFLAINMALRQHDLCYHKSLPVFYNRILQVTYKSLFDGLAQSKDLPLFTVNTLNNHSDVLARSQG